MDTCADVYVYVTDSRLYRFHETAQNQRFYFDGTVMSFSFVCTSVLPMRTCCALYILERFHTLWDFCWLLCFARQRREFPGRDRSSCPR